MIISNGYCYACTQTLKAFDCAPDNEDVFNACTVWISVAEQRCVAIATYSNSSCDDDQNDCFSYSLLHLSQQFIVIHKRHLLPRRDVCSKQTIWHSTITVPNSGSDSVHARLDSRHSYQTISAPLLVRWFSSHFLYILASIDSSSILSSSSSDLHLLFLRGLVMVSYIREE